MKKVLLAVIIGLFLFSVAGASAKSNIVGHKTTVFGIIYNGQGEPVANANVMVKCNGIIKNATSTSDGAYGVGYPVYQCGDNDTVTVVAQKGSLMGTSSGQVNNLMLSVEIAVVNVSMTPEFGFFAGLLTLVSAVGIFFVVRKD